MILAFIEDQRALGRSVGSICRALRERGVRVAERTYRAWKHAQPGVRDVEDAVADAAVTETPRSAMTIFATKVAFKDRGKPA